MNRSRLARSQLPHYERRSQFVRVALTIALPLQALLICEWLRPYLDLIAEAPFLASIAVVGWFCGPVHALAATLGSALLLDYLYFPPLGSLEIRDLGGAVRFFVFLLASSVAIALIANLHRAKAEIEWSEQAQRSMSELIPFGSWRAGVDGSMQHVSDSFIAAFGTTAEECLGDGWLQFVDPEQREQVRSDWQECMRSGYFWDAEYRMTGRNGAQYVVLSRGVPMRTPQGGVRFWVGIHLDITHLRHAAEKQIRQTRDIARFHAELEQFAYISAHDLQEPLRMITSYLQLLKRRYHGKLDAEADTYIDYAVGGADRLRALLQDLLVLQQIGKGNRALKACDLGKLIDIAIVNLGDAVPPGAVMRSDLPVVACNEREFVQLFENLIGNAVKYSRDGVPPQVHISAQLVEDFWEVSVRDNGIGIAPEYADRVFNVFQRLHTRARYEGTGIGLAIAKKIVEVHGGTIRVEPAPEAGSTFKFTIPA